MKAQIIKYRDGVRSSFWFVPALMAGEVVARVGAELIHGIDRLFPQRMGCAEPRPEDTRSGTGLPDEFDPEARPIGAAEDGYLQFVDADALMALATRENLLFRLERRPGLFVVMGCPLVTAWPGNGSPSCSKCG